MTTVTLQIDETRPAPEGPVLETPGRPRSAYADGGLTLGERRLLLVLVLVAFLLPACALGLGVLAGWFTRIQVDLVADAYWQLLGVAWLGSGLLVLHGKRVVVRVAFVVLALALVLAGHTVTRQAPPLAQQTSPGGTYSASLSVGSFLGVGTSLELHVVRPGSLISYDYPLLCQPGFSGDGLAPVITWKSDTIFVVDMGDAGHSRFTVGPDLVRARGWMKC